MRLAPRSFCSSASWRAASFSGCAAACSCSAALLANSDKFVLSAPFDCSDDEALALPDVESIKSSLGLEQSAKRVTERPAPSSEMPKFLFLQSAESLGLT